MNETIKMTGRLLVFDKVDKLGLLFPKDCEITFPEKVPVALYFHFMNPNEVVGNASVMKDERGLICDVELTNFDRDILHNTCNDELYIGGFYRQLKKHRANGVDIIDKVTLRGIGIILGPADDELKITLKED